jgi:hypothetical protein
VFVYPGADEVGLTILARVIVDESPSPPNFFLVFRNASTINYIPNYEGQPMIDTIQDQIGAAGGVIVSDKSDADIYFLVNNFSSQKQIEAPNQPLNRTIDEYDCFEPYLNDNKILGLADVRYSNGADIIFVQWMAAKSLPIEQFAYAGW